MAEQVTQQDAAANGPATIAAPIAPVLFKSRSKKANMRRRSPTLPPARNSDSDSDSDDNSSDGGLRRDKSRGRRKRGVGLIGAFSDGGAARNAPHHGRVGGGGGDTDANEQQPFTADRKALLGDSEAATKRSHLFDDEDRAGGASSKKRARTTGPSQEAAGGGQAGPTAAVSAPATGAASRSVGPVKAPSSNIRTITVTDFSPDVCKDYKTTGFCGFGDTCKFLHAREDYKQGWQLENEWEAVTKGKKHLGGTIVASADRKKNGASNNNADDDDDNDDDEEELRGIPFACILCHKGYTQPVVTRCGHYFCERCALERYRRDPTCAACGVATTGVFNNAKRLAKLLERKRARAARRRQAALEAGEEVSSDEEEGGEDSE